MLTIIPGAKIPLVRPFPPPSPPSSQCALSPEALSSSEQSAHISVFTCESVMGSGFPKFSYVSLTPGIAPDFVRKYCSLVHNVRGRFFHPRHLGNLPVPRDPGHPPEFASVTNCVSLPSPLTVHGGLTVARPEWLAGNYHCPPTGGPAEGRGEASQMCRRAPPSQEPRPCRRLLVDFPTRKLLGVLRKLSTG